MSVSTLQTADGLKLHTIKWLTQAAVAPKAVILIVHGISEHSGRYAHVAEFLNQRGYAVYSYDHRAHGKSQGTPRTYFDSFDQPVEDMKRVFDSVKAEHPGKKIFVYGHSMGSLISTLYMLKYQDGVAGWITSGSPLALNTAASAPVVAIGHLVARIAPKLPFVSLSSSLLSHDPEVVAAYDSDPLVDRRPPAFGMVSGMIRRGEEAKPHLQRITLPMLVIHGSADQICPPAGSQMLYNGAGSKDKTLKLYPDLYHELHNEPQKLAILGDIAAWLDARV